MSKELDIKDYLHLYLGCEVKHQSFVNPLILSSVSDIKGVRIRGKEDDVSCATLIENFKLILRPLSSMTEEEKIEIAIIFGWSHGDNVTKANATEELFDKNGYWNKITNISGSSWNKVINYCRKQGIDMDNLIDAGLAIDKTTLKQHQ